AANLNEFQMAVWPAAAAPGSSVQVRETVTSCSIGKATEIKNRNKLKQPQTQKSMGPSCLRSNPGVTVAWRCGHRIARLPNQTSSTIGPANNGQLNLSAPAVSKAVLKRIHISAGETFT